MKIVVQRMSGLFLTVFLVVVNAVLIEIIFDFYGFQRHRLLTGIIGTSIIILAFGYSMRKRKKLLTFGKAKYWLQSHEWLSIAGTFIIFVHTGTHFNALVPIITLIFMFTAFISGLIGRYVYNNARDDLKMKKKDLKKEGLSDEEIEQRLWALAVASETLSKWRKLHMPIVSILGIMVVYHSISALYYSGF